MNELTKRILVAFFGIPLVLILTWLGGWYFFAVILIISMVALWEFYDFQKHNDIAPQNISGLILGALVLFIIQLQRFDLILAVMGIGLLLILTNEMFRRQNKVSANIGVTLLGVIYIPVLLGSMLYLSAVVQQQLFPQVSAAWFRFVIMILGAIWICDTFAYAFGKAFGRHKLYEKVSPNKSIEGSVAGLLGSIMAVALVKLLGVLPLEWGQVVIFAVAIGVAGQIGDLVESWFKRDAGVKDSSAILPGHGGMLDRFDSLIFVAPVVLIIIDLFMLNR